MAGTQGTNLEAGTMYERMLFAGSPSGLLTTSCLASFFIQPRMTCLGIVPPTVSQAFLRQDNHSDMPTGQSEPDSSSIKGLSSQMSLDCVKLTNLIRQVKTLHLCYILAFIYLLVYF